MTVLPKVRVLIKTEFSRTADTAITCCQAIKGILSMPCKRRGDTLRTEVRRKGGILTIEAIHIGDILKMTEVPNTEGISMKKEAREITDRVIIIGVLGIRNILKTGLLEIDGIRETLARITAWPLKRTGTIARAE